MKPRIILLFSILFLAATANSQQQKYWQQQVDFSIQVSLNDVEHTLDGFERIDYFNNSNDTLTYIWFHVWQNAYKNDKTAFSDQLLENGRTDFYFSNDDKRGYINRLNFKVNQTTAKIEDHPIHQDIIKLILPTPLLPNSSCIIETPFHIKLPYNFSRGGHIGQNYQATQWYPKPAAYDSKGWHPMPYLDQGEFYSEFGNYDVSVTLPDNYIVAATGNNKIIPEVVVGHPQPCIEKEKNKYNIPSSSTQKTIQYKINNVHDFAWFASKEFITQADTLLLPGGKIIEVQVYYYNDKNNIWKNSLAFVKNAIVTKSKWVGDYPYDNVTVVEAENSGGGMEYPTITYLSSGGSEKSLESVINHEVGHNWFYGILASNERKHPWMDEGMNSYYDNKYESNFSLANESKKKSNFLSKRIPDNIETLVLQTLIAERKDQPIETTSEEFSLLNYNVVGYTKASQWLLLLEKTLGTTLFDSCMKAYYEEWKFKHPYPENFKSSIEKTSNQNLDKLFSLLNTKGNLDSSSTKKTTKLSSFFNFKETDKYNYIFVLPVFGHNFYDKFMIGAAVHNYTLPQNKFQYFVAPMYGTQSNKINGLGRLSYSLFTPKNNKLEIGLAANSFNYGKFTDSTNTTTNLRFSKVVPFVKYTFNNKKARSTMLKFVQWKTFLLNEQGLRFSYDSVLMKDVIEYPYTKRYLNQLSINIQNNRVLYPYTSVFMAEQAKEFIRLNFTGNYFFNYPKGGGVNVRFFAGKFLYLGDKTFTKQFATDAYHLNMSGPKGYEDYNYSNYFVGRSEFEKFSSQQIMIRDGAFKVRTDLLSNKIGKTDDWLAALNFTSTIPDKINPLSILPIKLPIRAFVDVGTYAEAWQKNAATSKFIYDAGLQLSILKNTINIYVPLLYSKVYKNYFASTITEKRFVKNISFSIDVQNLSLQKLIPQFNW